MAMAMAARWGTWEELLLGSAVLRHGAAAWDAVAAELQLRTTFPHLFSAQACEAKFEELQERYSASDFWFEELRKRRVAELKKELEKSEDSIGSLQAKLENLGSQRASGSSSECNTRQLTSSSPTEKSCDDDSFSRDMSIYGSSAGSFTRETYCDVLSTSQVVDSVSARDNQLKMEINSDNKEPKRLDNEYACFKKKRGKRKRRYCIIAKEGSTGDSDIINFVACVRKPDVFNVCKVDYRTPNGVSSSSLSGEMRSMDVGAILDSILENKNVSVFQCRLESQKKPQYKKLIRRHVDFLTIRKGILNGSISSTRELLRELLVLSNNALIFYPKDSTEYKSALTILKLANMTVGNISKHTALNHGEHDISSSALKDKSKEVAGIRPCNQNFIKKDRLPFKGTTLLKPDRGKKSSHVDGSVEYSIRKRAIGRPAKEGQRNGRKPDEGSYKSSKKRVRRS